MSEQVEQEVWSNTDGDTVTIVADPSVDVDSSTLRAAFAAHPEIGAITNWLNFISTADNGRPGQQRSGGIFERDRYTSPSGIFREFQIAKDASENDDVVSNILESTEALVFNTVRVECGDEDEENIWDQIIQDIQLDVRLREMWRDLFSYSQYYTAAVYTNKVYKVQGMGEQRSRRKRYDLNVPAALSLLDPQKVLPYGDFLFGSERLLYIANRSEVADIDSTLAGENTSDQVVTQLLTGKVELSRKEKQHLATVTGASELTNVYQFAPGLVWRHTASRPSYARFAPVRMKAVFELLDLKHQLRQMDRASLLGATNFIVLVKKGSEKEPATTGELEHLSTTVRQVSRTPLIVGDHRLSIEIITPDMDATLDPKRYNTLDSRIAARLYQIMHVGGFCQTPDVEVMTDSGWKFYHEIQDGDRAYSVDPETNEARFAEIEAVNVFDHDGPMHRIETRRLDVLSTPNHRWYTQYDPSLDKSNPDRHRFVTSSNLGVDDRIPLRFDPGDLPIGPVHKDQIVRLVAWYMTEGFRRYEYPNGKRCFIAQSRTANPEKVESIAADLASLWGEPGSVEDGGLWHYDGTTFSIAAEVGHEIVDLCPGRVKTPSYEFINSLTYDQLTDFVDTCIDGDGHREKNGRRTFYSKDAEIIDLFEYCAVRLGMSVTHSVDKEYHVDFDNRDETVWRVNIGFNSHTNPARAVRETARNGSESRMDYVHYTGKVWCPTTSTGTWVARRNGRVFYTGNSAGASGDDSLKLTRVIARGLESRRQMIKENIERNLLLPTWRKNSSLKSKPSLAFTPRSVALDFDPNFLQVMMELYNDGAISRETISGIVDVDQATEAHNREVEKERYDKIMKPRQQTQKQAGRRLGGNQDGGGLNPDSNVTNPTPRRKEADIPGGDS